MPTPQPTLPPPSPTLGYLGGRLYSSALVYSFFNNVAMMSVGFYLDSQRASPLITLSMEFSLYSLGFMSLTGALGFTLLMTLINKTHRRTFYEHLPLRAYVIEMWNTRTEAGLGEGMDASRAHLLKFSRCVTS